MEYGNSWTLGTAVNIALGLRPFLPAAGNPFIQPPNQPISTETAPLSHTPGEWQPPEITLHATPESLLSALFDIRVRFEADEQPGQSVGAGALLLRDADREQMLDTLATRFGIDFSRPDHGYALLTIRRTAGKAIHRSRERGVFGIPDRPAMVTPPFDRAIAQLRPCLSPARPAPDRVVAQQYLDCFRNWGTHYVSQVWEGDVIYQIMSYKTDRFAQLQAAAHSSPQSFSGPWAALGFSYFTRPRHGDFGYVEQCSPIAILSLDPLFAESVTSGAWHDHQWAGTDSILAPSLNQNVDLDAFTRVVPIAVELSSLGLFIEYYRKVTWRRICLAALYRKYGNNIQANFSQPSDPLDSQLNDGEGEFLSSIASPRIELFRRCFAPATMQLAAPDVVNSFTTVSNLLKFSEDSYIPGKSVSLLAYKLVAAGPTNKVPCLTLSDQAFAADRLWCQVFQGALQVAAASGKDWTLIADGVRYDRVMDQASGHYWLAATRDICAPPPSSALPDMRRALEFALVSTQSMWQVNQAAPVKGARERIRALFEWLASAIASDIEDEGLARLRLLALYHSRAAGTLAETARHLPYLRYDAYRDLVQSIIAVSDDISRTIHDYQERIRERQALERIMDVTTTLNANIVASGTLLADYITASARQQGDLARLHSSIVEQDDQAIAKTAASLQELDRLFSVQQMEVTKAVEHYQSAVADWESREIVKFSLDLCLNVFTAGFTIVKPISPAKDGVAGLSDTAKKVQKLVNSIAAINKVVLSLEGGIKNIATAQQAMESIEGGDDSLISGLEWSEFRANMKLALATGPAVAEKTALDTAFDILVQRAQARLTAMANAKKLIADRVLDLQRQQINQDQADRLQAIAHSLKLKQPDTRILAGIDLIGLSAELQIQQQQMALTLANTLLIQDQALQYEYQQQPLELPSTDINGLKMAIVRQHTQTLRAMQLLSPPPQLLAQPIEYVIEGVPVNSLINGAAFRFNIPLSAREFVPFTMVRVNDVTLHVEGVSRSDSATTVSRLLYLGCPFEDRNQDRTPTLFNTVSRQLEFLTDLNTGAVVFGGAAPVNEHISQVSPFSDWEVSFPSVTSNKGLAFNGQSVTLRLVFHIVAQLNDSPALHNKATLEGSWLPGQPLAAQRVETAATRQGTLSYMNNRSVTKGWDVVLSLSEEKINNLFEQQFNDRSGHPEFVREIPESIYDYNTRTKKTTKVDTPYAPFESGSDTIMRTIFTMTLDAPKIRFLSNNSQYAEVTMRVTGGHYTCIVASGKDHKNIATLAEVEDLSRSCKNDDATDSEVCEPTYITGHVRLDKVSGSVSSYKVVANLASGAFVISDVETTIIDPFFNSFISNYFSEMETNYELGALDMTPYTTYDALRPRSFQFSVMQTNSDRYLLQLFITTDGKEQKTLNLDLTEPVPTGDDCSLIISSRIVYQQLLPQSLRTNGSFLVLTGDDPGEAHLAWTGHFTRGLLEATFVSSNSDIRISADSNKVQLNFAGMTLNRTSAADLGTSYSSTQNRDFQYNQEVCHTTPGSTVQYCDHHWEKHSLDVTINMNTTLPIQVVGSGVEQKIRIATQSNDVVVSGSLSPAGACTTNDRELQSAFLDQLRSQLPGAIAQALQVQFSDISLFALKNLLFPANNIIHFSEAYVPGDMIVFGNVSNTLN